MTNLLPPLPRYIFCYAEPCLLLLAFLTQSTATQYFVVSQTNSNKMQELIASEKLLAGQLGNLFLVLGFVGVGVLQTTSEMAVVRAYLSALWWGDLGHVGITAYAMGWDSVVNVAGWSLVTWGNLGIPMGLWVLRSLYLLDVLPGGAMVKEQSLRE